MDEPYRIGVLSPPKWFNYCAEELVTAGQGKLRAMNNQIRMSRQFDYGLEDIRNAADEVRDAALSLADSDTHLVVQIGTPFATAHGWKGACDLEAKIESEMGLPFEMMGLSLPRACHDMGIETVTVGTVFYVPEWTQSYVAFLKEAGLNPIFAGSFADLGVLEQVTMLQSAMGHTLCTPEVLRKTVKRCCEKAPDAQAVILTGIPCPQLALMPDLEKIAGRPVISFPATYARVMKRLGVKADVSMGRVFEITQPE